MIPHLLPREVIGSCAPSAICRNPSWRTSSCCASAPCLLGPPHSPLDFLPSEHAVAPHPQPPRAHLKDVRPPCLPARHVMSRLTASYFISREERALLTRVTCFGHHAQVVMMMCNFTPLSVLHRAPSISPNLKLYGLLYSTETGAHKYTPAPISWLHLGRLSLGHRQRSVADIRKEHRVNFDAPVSRNFSVKVCFVSLSFLVCA